MENWQIQKTMLAFAAWQHTLLGASHCAKARARFRVVSNNSRNPHPILGGQGHFDMTPEEHSGRVEVQIFLCINATITNDRCAETNMDMVLSAKSADVLLEPFDGYRNVN